MEQYQQYQNKMENYLKLQDMMRQGDPNNPYYYEYGNEDIFYDEEGQFMGNSPYFDDEQYRLMSQGVMNGPHSEHSQMNIPPEMIPPEYQQFVSQADGRSRIQAQQQNNSHPPADFYNYSLVHMEDFLQDEGIVGPHSTDLVNSYYNSLALMQQTKPFLFPPRDLGMIESLGSFENTSKYMGSSAASNKITKAKDCNAAMELQMSSSKINSERANLEDSINEEIPCEIDELESEEEEDEPNFENQDQLLQPKKQRRKGGSPIILSNYSDSLKSIDDSKESKLTNNHKMSTEGAKESYYIIEDITKEGLTKFLRDAMKVYNDKYNVETEKFEDFELVPADFNLIYKYSKYVVVASKMEKEIPIVALVYLERLLTRTGILMNQENWRRLTLTTL